MTKAIITGYGRTGTNYLAGCMSNHPQVFCWRGEPFTRENRQLYRDTLCVMECFWNAPLYDVRMFKINYSRLRDDNNKCWNRICDVRPRVIHLYREDILRQYVSDRTLRARIEAGKEHGRDLVRLRDNPHLVLDFIENVLSQKLWFQKQVTRADLDVLELSYEEITDGGQATETVPLEAAEQICDFLGVDQAPLPAVTKKATPYTPDQVFENWPRIEEVVAGSKYSYLLEV